MLLNLRRVALQKRQLPISTRIMAALLPEFEYDIFISYRHNDSAWMDEFIVGLQTALRAVIKPSLSIYYDKDGTDGLGDTHLVQASLDHRVRRSIILIPLISLTYCDTTRYSWQHEFIPFLEQAKHDILGLNLNLPGGNVGSRILPLRIYNLEMEDKQLLEQTLGGQLRSIDFVYQEPGNVNLNRPLQVNDDLLPRPADGLLYRNQINKVANAIKELVTAIRLRQSAGPAAPPVWTPSPALAPVVLAAPTPPPAPIVPAAVPMPVPVAAPVLPAPVGVAPTPTGPVIFLAWVSDELKARREELALVCTKAGFHVVPTTDCPTDDGEFQRRTQEGLAAAVCALHLLGNVFGRRLQDDDECSISMYAYDQARLQAASRPAFQQFVWFPDEAPGLKMSQQAFVSKIRNELTEQCTFSSAPSAPQLVQDMRSAFAQAAPPPVSTIERSDICFINSVLDCDEANAITDQLSEAYMLDTLMIKPESGNLDKDLAVQKITQSKLAVVYFKHSADWALPFVKQVWQLVGGAASPTPILFVGEDYPEQNRLQSFKAPKVISRIQPHLGVSEEVQRVFQKLQSPA